MEIDNNDKLAQDKLKSYKDMDKMIYCGKHV